MADYSFLSKSDRLKQLQADFQQSLLTVDRSHLEPVPLVASYTEPQYIDYRALDRAQQRLTKHLADLEARGLYRVYSPDLDAYVLSTQPPRNNQNLGFSGVVVRQNHLDAEINSNCRATGLAEDGSAEFHFIEKNRHSLPVTHTKKAINLHFSGVTGESPEMAEKFGFCNTQTIAGRPAKIDIQKSDFLTR